MMDKPVTMSMKEFLTRKTAVDLGIPERVVNTVLEHQFDEAIKAVDRCNSIEMSGFGRFYFNRKKAEKKIDKIEKYIENLQYIMESRNTPVKKRVKFHLFIQEFISEMKYIKGKLDGCNKNIRRMEEQPVPPVSSEGSN